MGRRKKYNDENSLTLAKRKWRSVYYYKNRDKINKKRMRKYYENVRQK
jgi:hypothetical protein